MNEFSFSLHSLPKVSTRGKKRAGRGYGSGKGGHTSGRGQKGQKSRRTIPWSFEGGALPLSLRLPFWRGKGRLNPLKPKPAIVNIGDLERLKTGTAVDMALLIKEGFLTEKEARVQHVKILGRGKLTKKLTIVGLTVSMPAKIKIERVGGKVEAPQSMLPTSRPPTATQLQAGRSRGAQLRGSGVPADFSITKNQGPSEKMVKTIGMVKDKKTGERKAVKKPVKSVKKAVKKSATTASKKITKKTSLKKKSAKKASK